MTAEQKIKQRENIQKVNKLNVTIRPQQYVNPNLAEAKLQTCV